MTRFITVALLLLAACTPARGLREHCVVPDDGGTYSFGDASTTGTCDWMVWSPRNCLITASDPNECTHVVLRECTTVDGLPTTLTETYRYTETGSTRTLEYVWGDCTQTLESI